MSAMDIFSGGLSTALRNELGNVRATPPRNLGSEINQILGQNQRFYENAATYDPQYQSLALGLYGQAVPTIAGVLNQANTMTRTAGVNDLAGLAPGMAQAIRTINPQQTELYDALVTRAKEGLAAGSRLTPDQSYAVSNPIRSDYAARGFGESLPGDLDAAVALSRAGDNMMGQRQSFAAGVADMGNQFYTQPSVAGILGTGSNAAANYGAVAGTGRDATDGLLAYGSDLFNTNYNEEATRNIAEYNGRAGLMSTALSY